MTERPAAEYFLTRYCFQRALAFIYFVAFAIVVNQYVPLVGKNGLLPIRFFLNQIHFWDSPTLFWFKSSDSFLYFLGWTGLALSIVALIGISERFGNFFSALVWALLWLIYLSIVNAGQVFYGYGWETLLLETGFLTIFFGSSKKRPPTLIIWLLLWILFRNMFGAGLIKIRGDSCWRDLTCMFYHYETQPLPNPLSWYFAKSPAIVLKAEILFTHFVELIVPWALFAFRPICYVAGILTIIFQSLLILSGNLSWLNYITIVLCIPCFDDAFLSRFLPLRIKEVQPMSKLHRVFVGALGILILVLSIRPAINLFSESQLMNASFEPLHIVNTYGAFGSVTRVRNEIILEGTDEEKITPSTQWKSYEFKCKPGDIHRAPCIVSPYHYKIDWQMWFAAMSPYYYNPWILHFVAKLLVNDSKTLSLIEKNPFAKSPPKFIRAELYEYHFTDWNDNSGNWWKRQYVEEYLPPLSLDNPKFHELLQEQNWLP